MNNNCLGIAAKNRRDSYREHVASGEAESVDKEIVRLLHEKQLTCFELEPVMDRGHSTVSGALTGMTAAEIVFEADSVFREKTRKWVTKYGLTGIPYSRERVEEFKKKPRDICLFSDEARDFLGRLAKEAGFTGHGYRAAYLVHTVECLARGKDPAIEPVKFSELREK